MMTQPLTIFVSSTSKDLSDYRAIARNVVLEMGWTPKMMEHFGALPESTVTACCAQVTQSDALLLIVGFQRGWVPSEAQGGNGTSSITALELDAARKHKIPVLVMMASETWPQNLCEKDGAAHAWLEEFRAGLNLPAEFFDYEVPTTDESKRLPGFRNKVKNVLLAHRERLALQKEPAAARPTADYRRSARIAMREGNCIPFVGPGVYGSGPLSTPELIREMWPDAPAAQACLATSAAYYEQTSIDRAQFLSEFARILTDHAQAAAPPAVHGLISRLVLRPTPLVVSACHDMVLEDQLSETRRCAVVSHIIRSRRGEQDGRLLVSVRGEPPQIRLADKLNLEGFDLVIYKPLGSPLLHLPEGSGIPSRWPGPDDDLGIDTVVATETDHLTFLGRLDNQHTQVPSVFHRPFQRRVVLFLGLQLDTWHYRLVLQVFRSVQVKFDPSHTPPIAVRTPESTMETLAWENLNTKTIHMDPNEFADDAEENE